MKKIKLILIFLIIFVSFGYSQKFESEESIFIDFGLDFTPGLVYNGYWDPGYTGSSAVALLNFEKRNHIWGAGIITGYSRTGFHLQFPLKAGFAWVIQKPLKLYATATLKPGMILSRPSPYFLLSAEAAAELFWSITQDFRLSLSAGPQYTYSPDYSLTVTPYSLIDLNIGIFAGFRLEP